MCSTLAAANARRSHASLRCLYACCDTEGAESVECRRLNARSNTFSAACTWEKCELAVPTTKMGNRPISEQRTSKAFQSISPAASSARPTSPRCCTSTTPNSSDTSDCTQQEDQEIVTLDVNASHHAQQL